MSTETEGRYEGTAIIDQNFFSIYLTIDWGTEGNTKFLLRSPLVSNSDGILCFPALFEWNPVVEGEHQAAVHRAAMYCHVNSRHPEHVEFHYSTIDKQIGKLEFHRRA